MEVKAETCNFIKKETLAYVVSCEFCQISKNTFSYRTPPVATSQSVKISVKGGLLPITVSSLSYSKQKKSLYLKLISQYIELRWGI